jgi:protein-S-isoprenylcysteine O-methyltransferase Ste14
MNLTITTPDVQANAIPSRGKLAARVVFRIVTVLTFYGAFEFAAAGTWRFWQAWVFPVFTMLPVAGILLWLVITDPQTAMRRLERREPTATQRNAVRYFIPVFFLVLLVPGLDRRLGWTRMGLEPVPAWISLAADVQALAAIAFITWTIQVNRYAAATIRVEEGQKAISTGPYRFVRHPMYAGAIVQILCLPVALGSLVGIPFSTLLLPFFAVRLLEEEKMLRRDLPGYAEYCQKTRWRLAPFVW